MVGNKGAIEVIPNRQVIRIVILAEKGNDIIEN